MKFKKSDDDEKDKNVSYEEAVLRQAATIPLATTRSGAAFRDIAAANIARNPIRITKTEEELYRELRANKELGCVGAGVGGGFDHTTELHVMKYRDAVASGDATQWSRAVEEEHDRMVDNEVWSPVHKEDIPPNAKVLTSTWARKRSRTENAGQD
jgi:hypothetical protein